MITQRNQRRCKKMDQKERAIRYITDAGTTNGERAIAYALLAILEQLEKMQKKEE